MQTILGASGQIGHEPAVQLERGFIGDFRLISRNPKRANEGDQIHKFDLLDAYETGTVFVPDEFRTRFPDFHVTTFREGLAAIRDGHLAPGRGLAGV